jgi:hypothetical protein
MRTALQNFRKQAKVRRPSGNRRKDLAKMHRDGRKLYGPSVYRHAILQTFDPAHPYRHERGGR